MTSLPTTVVTRPNGGTALVSHVEVRLDLSDEIALAADPRALLNRLDLVLMYGTMSNPMRDVLLRALTQTRDPERRVIMALQLIAIAPEYAVLQ